MTSLKSNALCATQHIAPRVMPIRKAIRFGLNGFPRTLKLLNGGIHA